MMIKLEIGKTYNFKFHYEILTNITIANIHSKGKWISFDIPAGRRNLAVEALTCIEEVKQSDKDN